MPTRRSTEPAAAVETAGGGRRNRALRSVQQRLQKILSAAGIASRRAAETLHHARPRVGQWRDRHRARIEGRSRDRRHPRRRPARQAAARRLLHPAVQTARLHHQPLRSAAPADGHRSSRARGACATTSYPVGRLDYESEGLLLLTSDGELAARLTHPRHGVEREYQVKVRGVPDEHDLERLAKGIVIDGRRTVPADVKLLKVIEGTSAAARPALDCRERRTQPPGAEHVRRDRPSRRPAAARAHRPDHRRAHPARRVPGAGCERGRGTPALCEGQGVKKARRDRPTRRKPDGEKACGESFVEKVRPETDQPPHRRRGR